jgi:probable F420-dependent oxidoreductase
MAGEHPFRFGVVSATAASGQDWIDRARRAESLGYGTVLMPDTLGPTLSPLPALGVLAGATSTIHLGTFVLANDLRHPVLVAREAATLQLLSGGRFELGLGAGRPGAEADNAKLGLPFDSGGTRVGRLTESLRLIRTMLEGGTVDAEGPFYTSAGGDAAPKVQPRPPIMVAATGPRLLGVAAREADIVAIGTGPQEDEAGLRRRIDTLREAAPDRFDRLELSISLNVVGDLAHPMLGRFGTNAELLTRAGVPSALSGPPENMAEQLQRTRDALGVSYITVWEGFVDALAPVVERLAGR